MRSRTLSLILVTWFLALSSATAAPSTPIDFNVPTEALVKLGVDMSEFVPGAVSYDESMLAGHQKILDPKEIAKGHSYKLFIFKIDRATRSVTAKTVFLSFANLEQYAWTADDKSLLCLGGWGTQISAVDVATGGVRTVFEHQKGQPGFRVMPAVTWMENGKVHVPGYTYDERQVSTGRWIMAIDPSKTGISALEKVLDITTLVDNTTGWSAGIWFNSKQAYFVSGVENNKQRTIALFAFTGDQQKLNVLETCKFHYDLSAVGQDRIISVMRDAEKEGRAVIIDQALNKQWRVGEAKKVYYYPYMSHDGGTILLSTFDLAASKMSTYYAHEGDAWSLHPVSGMTNIFPGVIRYSAQGKLLAFYNKDGLHFKHIP